MLPALKLTAPPAPIESGVIPRHRSMSLFFRKNAASPIRPAFRIQAVGGWERASSRLRAWRLAEFLARSGFEARVNGGWRFDILICQKTYPFALARLAQRAGRTILFDLDDPDFDRSPRWRTRIRKFTALAHGVTAGSDYLQAQLAPFHREIHVLENPVDVLDPRVRHTGERWRGKLVWFGASENLWMLNRLNLRHPVHTLTQGGDIPFALKTVDRELCGFDLALLPVFINEETRAKNANRLVKCAALGLPFLASDTPAHRKALQRIGLPADGLMPEGRDWDEAVEAVARDYTKWKAAAEAGRAAAWEAYGADRVFSDWLRFSLAVWERTRAEAKS
jgi:hypothetical protein